MSDDLAVGVSMEEARRMVVVVDCRECTEVFTGDARWSEYAAHLRAEHRLLDTPSSVARGGNEA